MKQLFLFFTLIACLTFTACSTNESVKNTETAIAENTGKVLIENGTGKQDTVEYTCINCKEEKITQAEFDVIVKESTKQSKEGLKFPRSFVPQKINITILQKDSIYQFSDNKKIKDAYLVSVDYTHLAQNMYGVEAERTVPSQFYMQNGKIVDLTDKVKLEDLAVSKGYITRSLYISSQYGEILIHPYLDGDLIVTTSVACVDEGSWLTLQLKNGSEIRLVSWNEFNCDSKSYFKITNAQFTQLKASPIDIITFTDDQSIACQVPLNESDYFIQWINLLKK